MNALIKLNIAFNNIKNIKVFNKRKMYKIDLVYTNSPNDYGYPYYPDILACGYQVYDQSYSCFKTSLSYLYIHTAQVNNNHVEQMIQFRNSKNWLNCIQLFEKLERANILSEKVIFESYIAMWYSQGQYKAEQIIYRHIYKFSPTADIWKINWSFYSEKIKSLLTQRFGKPPQPIFRQIMDLVSSHLPTKSYINLSRTCKESHQSLNRVFEGINNAVDLPNYIIEVMNGYLCRYLPNTDLNINIDGYYHIIVDYPNTSELVFRALSRGKKVAIYKFDEDLRANLKMNNLGYLFGQKNKYGWADLIVTNNLDTQSLYPSYPDIYGAKILNHPDYKLDLVTHIWYYTKK